MDPLAFIPEGDEDLKYFQGAPLMPRMDNGDAFDRILQRWLENSTEDMHDQGLQKENQRQRGQGVRLKLEPDVSPFMDDYPPLQNPMQTALPHQQDQLYTQQYLNPPTSYNMPFHNQVPQTLSQPHSSYQQQAKMQQQPAVSFAGPQQEAVRPTSRSHFSQTPSPMPPQTSSREPAQAKAYSSATPSPLSSTTAETHHPAKTALTSHGDNISLTATAGSPLPQLPAISSVTDAQQAWPKRKRGPLSEASKEKERARNRRAQKRFREREKERQEERQEAMTVLENELASMKEQNTRLEERNTALEQAMLLRKEQKLFDNQPAEFDGQYYIESQIDDPSELLPELTLASCARKFTNEDVSGLTYAEHTKIYRIYIDALRQEMGKAESPSRQEAMIKHVSELCALNLAVALAKPLEFAQFHVSKLDEDTPSAQQPPIQAKLHLSEDQKKGLLEYRRWYLRRLSPLLKQRWELQRLMHTTFPKDKEIMFRTSHAKSLEAAERLNKNLRQEQTLLVQSMCASHQQVLAPIQTCTHIVTAYPYYPDVPMLVEALAMETPGELSAAVILDIQSLPSA